MSARLADLLIRHPLLVMSVLLCVTAAAAALALRMEFDFAPQAMLKGDDNLARDLEEFKRTFSYEDAVLMVLIESTREADVLDARALTWQADLARTLEARPEIDRIESLATATTIRRTLSLRPEIFASRVIREVPVDDDTADRLRRLVDKSPLMEGALLSSDRRIAVVMAFLKPRVQALEEVRGVIDAVREELRRRPPPEGYRAHLTGLPYLRVDTVDNLQADQRRLLPIAAGVYLVTLSLTFRRVSGSLLPLLAVGMGLAWMIGSIVALGESFNLVSNILPVLTLIIGVSNCVHIVADYGEQTLHTHGNRTEAVRKTIRHMSGACLLTLLTTAIGFASLFTAQSDVLQSFGWQAAIGMGCLYVAIIGTLGTLLRFFRPPRRSAAGAPLGGIVSVSAAGVARHPGVTLVGAAIVIGIAVWLGSRVHVNSSMIETYDERHPTLQSLRLVENRLGGLLPVEVSLRADRPGRFLESDVYRRVTRFESFARAQQSVLFARSYVDFHDAVGAELTALSPRETGDAESDDDLTRRLERSAWVIERVGARMNYSSFMTADDTRARILLKVRDVGTRRLRALDERLAAELAATFPPESGIHASLTGDAYVNTLAMNGVIHDLRSSLLSAAAVIFTIIAVGFRSLRIGLISAIPNVTPLLCTLGYMGLRGYDLNVGNVIVFTISLGIAVDDTVHFLSRYQEEIANGRSPRQAVEYAFQTTGRAMLIVTLLIICGLAVLLLSDFVPTRRFAELTSFTMAAALFGDLLVLPACLLVFARKPRESVAVGTTHPS